LLTSRTDRRHGRFMAGYCSNLSWSFWLIYPANKAQWQVWQLFPKTLTKSSKEQR
jgi:hypothetical protein